MWILILFAQIKVLFRILQGSVQLYQRITFRSKMKKINKNWKQAGVVAARWKPNWIAKSLLAKCSALTQYRHHRFKVRDDDDIYDDDDDIGQKCNLAKCSALTQYRHRHRFSRVHDDEDVDKGVGQTGLDEMMMGITKGKNIRPDDEETDKWNCNILRMNHILITWIWYMRKFLSKNLLYLSRPADWQTGRLAECFFSRLNMSVTGASSFIGGIFAWEMLKSSFEQRTCVLVLILRQIISQKIFSTNIFPQIFG